MSLEEAVSKGQCIVTAAQQQTWSQILPLRSNYPLCAAVNNRCQPLPSAERISWGTPWVVGPRHLLQAMVFQSLHMYPDRLWILPFTAHVQTPSLPLAGLLHGSKTYDFNSAYVVYIYFQENSQITMTDGQHSAFN